MKHAAYTLAIAATFCAAASAGAAERDKPKSQEIVVADAKDTIAQAERDRSVEELKAVFRRRLAIINRWSQLR